MDDMPTPLPTNGMTAGLIVLVLIVVVSVAIIAFFWNSNHKKR